MIYLVWERGHWGYKEPGIIIAKLQNTIVEIPIGKSRFGAFYIHRIGEFEWNIAPLKFPKMRPESYDSEGRFNDFIHLSGGDDETHKAIDSF